MNLVNSEMSFALAFACSAPVFTSADGGSSGLISPDELLGRDTGLRRDGDQVVARLAEQACAVLVSKIRDRGAAERVDRAELRDADDPVAA